MISIELNNRSSVLSTLAINWIKTSNKSQTSYTFYDDDEDDYLKALWMNAFGIHGGSSYWDDDDDWEDYYSQYDNPPSQNTHPTDDDDAEDEYSNFFEPMDVVTSGIWDDDAEWDEVAKKYDTFDKSSKAIDDALRSSYYSPKPVTKQRQSKIFKDIDKNKKREEDDWRREILNESTDNGRKIYFYQDARQESEKQEFDDLDDFLMFCADNDIYVDEMCKSDIEFYTQCHCGLDGYALSNGHKDLRCARSYGELMYDLYGSDLFYDESLNFAQSSKTDDLPF